MARRPFVVNVADLRRSGSDRHEHRQGLITAAVLGSAVVEGEPVVADLVLHAAGDAIEAVGTVRASW